MNKGIPNRVTGPNGFTCFEHACSMIHHHRDSRILHEMLFGVFESPEKDAIKHLENFGCVWWDSSCFHTMT
jgi:hypothetical protein